MLLHTKQIIGEQQGIVLFTGKKVEAIQSLPPAVEAERKLFSDEKEDFRTLQLQGTWYVFMKEQTNDEATRVAGHKARAFFPKSVTTIGIHAGKSTSLLIAEGILLSNYQFLRYRKEAEKEKNALLQIDFTASISDSDLHELSSLVKAVSWARDLVNEPVSFLNATELAKAIEAKGEEAKFSVNILEKSKIEALKMGGLLAVNQGSVDPPTFTIIEYKPKKAINKKPIVLVGKGVVYDTGGLSLKPTPGLWT